MKKRFKNPEEIKRIMLLKATTTPEKLDHKYQVILRDLKKFVDGDDKQEIVEIDDYNKIVKLDVLALMTLYKEGVLEYVDMYNLIIKVIGYDFMYNELTNRKSDGNETSESES